MKPYSKWSKIASSAIFVNFLFANVTAQTTEITTSDAEKMYSTISMRRTSVHDPSVIYEESSRQYYIFGSHMAVAKTTDMQNWDWVGVPWAVESENGLVTVDSYTAFTSNRVKEIIKNGEKVPFGNFDASAWNCGSDPSWINGNMWAPDIIYNPEMGKWCQYLSLNGIKWNSSIVLLTADNIEGPYVYEGPVIYTGFINDTDEAISFRKTDMEIVLGPQSSLPERYNQGEQWWEVWPHAIDPTVFYDEEGKLWMAYGSWFGGIYILELDKTTGLRDYDVTYESNYDSRKGAVTSDAYFGKKIAGGCGASGEGPYIQYIGEYYYLFVTNGEFAPDGGYEMRIFRSKNPDGPYKDLNNIDAIYSKWAYNYGTGDTRGSKLIGAYNNFGFQSVGECSQGHNSAIIGPDGNTYLVYHTKFNDGTFGHQVRVHQMFMNRNGWPVVAPFEYNGETVNEKNIESETVVNKNEVPGVYNVILHRYGMDHRNFEESTPVQITLNEDGTIAGAMTGKWSIRSGTSYITLTLNNSAYEGVIVEQQMEPTTIKAICFTGCNSAGVHLWGYKPEEKSALAYSVNNLELPFKNNARITSHLDLYGVNVMENVKMEWSSDKPEIISNTGIYNPTGMTSYEGVTLTLKLSAGDYFWTKDYSVIAREEMTYAGDYLTGINALYEFDQQPVLNAFNVSQEAQLKKQGTNSVPVLEKDSARVGKVLHQYFGASGNTSYTQIVNPLRNNALDGMTVSMWVKRNDAIVWDAIWSFYNSTKNCRLYMTGNSYIGFNNGKGDWFDINHPGAVISDNIPVGQWTLVTLTVSRKNGVKLYINGNAVSKLEYAGSASDFDYNLILDFIQECPSFYLGYGSFWGSADVCIDDVMIYNRELDRTDVSALNKMCNRVTDFVGKNEITGITDVKADQAGEGDGAIYDLKGRRVTNPENGIYIINGKKHLIK